jgi:hypothetical protein
MARSTCSGQGACEVCVRIDMGEGEHEACWHTWVCVLPSSSPSESGAPTEQCYGTGAGVGAVELCST